MEAEFSLLAGTQPFPSEAGLDLISLSEASSSLPSSLEVPLRQLRFWKAKAKKEGMPASSSSGVKRAKVGLLLGTEGGRGGGVVSEENTGRYLNALSARNMHMQFFKT